jgi:hypothetical protein
MGSGCAFQSIGFRSSRLPVLIPLLSCAMIKCWDLFVSMPNKFCRNNEACNKYL